MENYKPQLDNIQDGMLDLLNQEDIDIDALSALLEEYSATSKLIVIKLRQYTYETQERFPKEYQEYIIQIAHIKNIADILRKRLSL